MSNKDKLYFQHDFEPTSDPKIIALLSKFGATGYGVFWRIIEMLHSNSEHKLPKKEYVLVAIAQQMLTSVEQISAILTFATDVCELFLKDENFIVSERVNRNFQKMESISAKRSEAGKRSASTRYQQVLNKSQQVSTSVQQNSTNTNKIKENKIKENTPYNPPLDGSLCETLPTEIPKSQPNELPPNPPDPIDEFAQADLHNEHTLVGSMMKVWKQHFPRYQEDVGKDYLALRELAEKIAKSKAIPKHEIFTTKKVPISEAWDKISGFVKTDNFYRTKALSTINNSWQTIYQKMDDAVRNAKQAEEQLKPVLKF
jgi:uncharacterized protein YdaU (DUF1376 family)